MGQSASQPTRQGSLEGKDVRQLNDGELRALLEMRPWTREEVLVVAKSLAQLERPNFGFYSKEDDSPETDLAVRLNTLSKELAKLRFSIVPSRIKEPVFWESVFTILKERLVEHNAKFKWNEVEANSAAQPAVTNGYRHPNRHPSSPTKASSSFPDDEVEHSKSVVASESLKSQLAAKDFQIAALQRQVQDLQAALESTGTPQTVTVTVIGHHGTWIMDQDSQDFLSYPEEVKENMRREKQKRLKQVQQDMQFILDSDRPEDSNGHWQCCGETLYHSTCPKAKKHNRR